MKFKLDENVPWILKTLIESKGKHQVDTVFHEKITGTDDQNLLEICKKDERILITQDNDFLKETYFNRSLHFGIVILKSKTQGKKAVKDLFERFLSQYSLEETLNKIVIIEPNQIKIRE